jgi:hypothetical protein
MFFDPFGGHFWAKIQRSFFSERYCNYRVIAFFFSKSLNFIELPTGPEKTPPARSKSRARGFGAGRLRAAFLYRFPGVDRRNLMC